MATATAATNERPTEIPTNKHRIQIAIEYVDQAFECMTRAATVLSSELLSLQRAADDIRAYRDQMIGAVENTGGMVNLEHQFRDMIPLKYRQPEPDTKSE